MRDALMMRTTLSISDDVLAAARAIAEAKGVSIGDVISDLARRSLVPEPNPNRTRSGIPLLPWREDGGVVTPELIRSLLDDDEP
jgi:hypothetical protein